ncbi:MAG: glycosyltransferase family 9 protein [Nitrospinota bacterium]
MEFLLKNNIKPDAKILLIKLRSIGDVVYNTAVYSPIKKHLPKAKLTVLVESPSYDIVKNHPNVDEVLCFEKTSFLKQAKFYLNLIFSRYDVAIDMHEGTRGAVMCFLSRARFKVGNVFAKRSFLYNTKINFSDLKPSLPVDYQVALIKKMGIPFENSQPIIHVSDAWRKKGKDLLASKNFDPDKPYCIIHPGARKYDQWQYEKFAEIAEYFYKNLNLGIILTCGPGQFDQAEKLIQCLPKDVPHTFVSTELSILLGITASAKFVVCHNGGYMHATSAIGIPVVALFGLTDHRIWKPLGENSSVLHKAIDCWPCNSKTMKQVCWDGKPECKELITTQDVIDSIKKLCPEFSEK